MRLHWYKACLLQMIISICGFFASRDLRVLTWAAYRFPSNYPLDLDPISIMTLYFRYIQVFLLETNKSDICSYCRDSLSQYAATLKK